MAAQKMTLKLKRPDTTPVAPSPMQVGGVQMAGYSASAGGFVQQKKPHYTTFAILTIFSVIFMLSLLITQWMEWDYFMLPSPAFYVPESYSLSFSDTGYFSTQTENGTVEVPGWMAELRLMHPTYAILGLIDQGGETLIYTVCGVAAFLVLLFTICLWRLLAKAGQAGWLSLVPVYNAILFARLAGRSAWWIALLLVPFLNIAIYIDLMIGISRQYRKGVGFAAGMVLFPILMLPVLAFSGTTHVDYEPPKPEEAKPTTEAEPSEPGATKNEDGDDEAVTSPTAGAVAPTAAKTLTASKIRTVKKPTLTPKGPVKTIRKPADS